jgi:hypothetical protein
MTRRLLTATAGLALVVSVTACGPSLGNGGWSKARTPNRQSISVAPIPDLPGVTADADLLAPWNYTAGWQLFQPVSTATADITFASRPILCKWSDYNPAGTACNNAANAIGAYPELYLNPGGTMRECRLLWSEHAAGTVILTTTVLQHEIGHCLGFTPGGGIDTCAPQTYLGVMSYCGFYWSDATGLRPNWWGIQDQQMLQRAGYR